MRKSIKFILTLILVINMLATTILAAGTEPPPASADGVVLMDANSGTIIYSKNMDTQYPPASTTKIMTALLALEKSNLDDEVVVSKTAPFADGSKIYIEEDEKFTMKDLLYALMLQSANDAAEAIAEHISGSTEEFATLMNERAKELGCTNTNFVNPHGLYDENHRTSAHDLALILKELSSHPEYIEIAKTPMYYIEPTNKQTEQRPIWNKNRLIQSSDKYYYADALAGKTGYTVESMHSFVAVAERDGVRLIAVLLHDSAHTYWDDVRSLFDWGFDNFSLATFIKQDDSLGTYSVSNEISIPIAAATDFNYLKDNSSTDVPTLKILDKDISQQSFKKGDLILKGQILLGEESLGELDICAEEDYTFNSSIFQKNDSEESKKENSTNIFMSVLKYVGIVLLILVVLLRTRKVIIDKKRKKRKLETMKKNMYFQRYYKK
ncbi:D-alanyl-D-alanine carboxypeptidase family protein [Clostridium grantii]|uniref:D-alanyl-D-alanine carboxypeptidase n=1 Tax=Clostridium grantii DSM 8605 TaxID=1121316 RepID=A0A1M5X4M3_9CLOT|nr:D-alanyl-D-alanine carboxypeptidase family protein [Clostridium grantii]SHH94769.1 D-alanyl-D-alanine carboxypeptidase [Clostridium grantii DSM 8605]